MSAVRPAPGTSKIATSLPSGESLMRLLNNSSREMVGEDLSYLVM